MSVMFCSAQSFMGIGAEASLKSISKMMEGIYKEQNLRWWWTLSSCFGGGTVEYILTGILYDF